MTAIFLCGPLTAPHILSRLAGGGGVQGAPADLPDHGLRAVQGIPVLAASAGEGAEGSLIRQPTPELCAGLDRLSAASGALLQSVSVLAGGERESAHALVAPQVGAMSDWVPENAPVFEDMLEEILRPDLSVEHVRHARAGLLRRALGRINARRRVPQQLGTPIGAPALRGVTLHRHHGGFFVTEGLRFSHRLIGGGWSGEIDREVFVTGDAVSVLPWDPATGQLLLIRQIRAGMVARQDPDPWNVEAIAGLVDRAEDGPATARREAEEEAALTLGRIAPLAEYYTSPGTMTEYIRSYVALCDLSEYQPGIHGLEAENEDIETLLVSEAEAADALDRGEVRNAPLMISLLAFFRKREELTALWGLPLAGGGPGT